jgi:hypothetical protein
MHASRREPPEELWRRIAETMERMEEKLNLLAEKQQCIEQALQQKPDRDEVKDWVTELGWDMDKFRDDLSDVASIMASEDDVEGGIRYLEDRIEEKFHELDLNFPD